MTEKEAMRKTVRSIGVIALFFAPIFAVAVIKELRQEPYENKMLIWADCLYEYIDYYPEGSIKPIHIIPDQKVWDKYGYRAARWGLYNFALTVGNKPLSQPTSGRFCVMQDNGMMWLDHNGDPLQELIKVVY